MLKVLDLFSGIGGFSLGLERTGGFQTVAFCEIDPFCRRVLAKHWPHVHCYPDIRELSSQHLTSGGTGPIDAVCGGFPCQDISNAGERVGISGERSGLWFQYARLIGELGPRYVIVENVAALLDRGMADVLGTLSDLGYDAEWSVVTSCSLGATHMRPRMFIVAYPNGQHGRQGIWYSDARQDGAIQTIDRFARARAGARARMANPSSLYRDAAGLPDGMDRNHAIGNSVDPAVIEYIGRRILASSMLEAA